MESIEIIWPGVVMIIIGIGIIIFMSRRPPTTPLWSVDFKGYGAGIAFILIGIVNILIKLQML